MPLPANASTSSGGPQRSASSESSPGRGTPLRRCEASRTYEPGARSLVHDPHSATARSARTLHSARCARMPLGFHAELLSRTYEVHSMTRRKRKRRGPNEGRNNVGREARAPSPSALPLGLGARDLLPYLPSDSDELCICIRTRRRTCGGVEYTGSTH